MGDPLNLPVHPNSMLTPLRAMPSTKPVPRREPIAALICPCSNPAARMILSDKSGLSEIEGHPVKSQNRLLKRRHEPLTRFRRGFAFFAFADAFRVDAARMAPAAFFEYPSPWIFDCTALNPGCADLPLLAFAIAISSLKLLPKQRQ